MKKQQFLLRIEDDTSDPIHHIMTVYRYKSSNLLNLLAAGILFPLDFEVGLLAPMVVPSPNS